MEQLYSIGRKLSSPRQEGEEGEEGEEQDEDRVEEFSTSWDEEDEQAEGQDPKKARLKSVIEPRRQHSWSSFSSSE